MAPHRCCRVALSENALVDGVYVDERRLAFEEFWDVLVRFKLSPTAQHEAWLRTVARDAHRRVEQAFACLLLGWLRSSKARGDAQAR